MESSFIYLKQFSVSEASNNGLNSEIRPVDIGEFNVVMGDNAQGKTRLFNFLRFFRQIFSGVKPIFPQGEKISGDFLFEIDGANISYKISLRPTTDGAAPIFDEVVTKNGAKLFSTSEKLLVDEKTNRHIDNFFIPSNVPALTAINDQDKFKTLYQLKSFFERMCFLEANRLDSSNIDLSIGSQFLDFKGRNASCVVETWKKKSPSAYEEIQERFEEIFPWIKEGSFSVKKKVLPGLNMPTPLLTYVDSDSQMEYPQTIWSDGLLRTICLLILPATRFGQNGEFERPSLIYVDEIENGLDFNTLRKVIDIYKDYSIHTQILISSHSPNICNLTSPECWRIAKRKGFVVEYFSPKNVEGNLEEQRKQLLEDNWEFYKRHISKSPLYSVK